MEGNLTIYPTEIPKEVCKKKKKKVYVYDNHSTNYNNAYGKQPKDQQ